MATPSSIELSAVKVNRPFDDVEVGDGGENDCVDDQDIPIITSSSSSSSIFRRCGCLSLFLLVSLAVALVSRVYMQPQSSDVSTELPFDTEVGGTVTNDAVNDNDRDPSASQSDKKSTNNHKNSNNSSTAHSDRVKTWLDNHGEVPDDMRHNHVPEPVHPRSNNNNPTSTNTGSTQQQTPQRVFDNQQWQTSKVTLDDGVMFRSVRQLVHDPGAFLEGLTFAKGFLFESTGLEGQSSVRKLNANTGEIIEQYDLEDKTIFGEGLTFANDKLFQITYKKKLGFIYDVNNISQPIDTFTFDSTTGEGWGLTYSPHTNELIMSDGSTYLHMIDADTLRPTRTVQVRREGGLEARNINELEFFHGKVLANVWFKEYILVIDPETGLVEKEYDFATIWPKAERRQTGAGVLNGISVARNPAQLYITGKNWDRMFLVELKF